MRATIIAAICVLAAGLAHAKTPQQLKADLASMLPAGKKARCAWSQGGSWSNAANLDLYGVDSDDGIVRKINSTSLSVRDPQITADGSRVVFTDVNSDRIMVINWDGTGLRTVVNSGYSTEYWQDPNDKSEWVINPGGGGAVYRNSLDLPARSVLLWNKTGVTYGCMGGLSLDGTHLAGWFGSPQRCGTGVVPNGTLTTYTSAGCGMGMANDNSYDYFVHWDADRQNGLGGHAGIRICNGSTSKQTVVCIDSINKWVAANRTARENTCNAGKSEFDWAKWTSDRNYITFSMFNTNANPFLFRISDRKWIHISDDLGCIYTNRMDVCFYTAGQVSTSRMPASMHAGPGTDRAPKTGACTVDGRQSRETGPSAGRARGMVVHETKDKTPQLVPQR